MRIASAIVVAVVAVTGSARAETAPPWDTGCFAADAIVPASLPANVTGIPIAAAVDAVSVSLLAEDGTVVPTKLAPDGGYSILVPLAPLTPGKKYTVRVTDECTGYRTESFIATAAVPLPSAAGTAIVGPYEDYFSGTCDASGKPYMNRYRSVYLSESPDMTPWLAISKIEFVVDDVAGSYRWGLPEGTVVGAQSITCPNTGRKSRVAVQVRLPNGPTFITPDVQVTMVCPDVSPKECEGDVPVGEPTPIDAAPAPAASADAGSAPSAAPGDDLIRAGCHYSPGELGGAAWAVATLAAIGLRRRRSQAGG